MHEKWVMAGISRQKLQRHLVISAKVPEILACHEPGTARGITAKPTSGSTGDRPSV